MTSKNYIDFCSETAIIKVSNDTVKREEATMDIISSEKRLCPCCMEEHAVKLIKENEHTVFKNVQVDYEARYFYCDQADELYTDEELTRRNDIAMKDSYRRAEGLMISSDIRTLRDGYGISQSDLCILMGWGAKTITRYETHQVQDRAHDTILRKLEQDPEWFVRLLLYAKELISAKAYERCMTKAAALCEEKQDMYLRKTIEAGYMQFYGNREYTGGAGLSLDRVVDVVRYFANSNDVRYLFKVKLMKMLWYADFLAYKETGRAITGLVYRALPMGAVPVSYDSIMELKGVRYEELDMGNGSAYKILPDRLETYKFLSEDDMAVLDTVIKSVGAMTKNEIVSFMHKEKAYKETQERDYIKYEYARYLQI